MNQPYNANQPIEFLIQQIQDVINYADHAGTLYSPTQTPATAYNLVFKTGVFSTNLCDWRRKPDLEKNGPIPNRS